MQLSSSPWSGLCDTTVTITGDPKTIMQYDCYEKFIVIEKGVKLINWPADIPFVNASAISLVHSLRHLFKALTLDDEELQCHWVHLSEEEMDKRREAYYEAEDAKSPRKWKRKVREEQSDSDSSGSEAPNAEGSNAPPAKKSRGSNRGKENDAAAANEKKKRNGPKGKGKVVDKAGPSAKKQMGGRSNKANEKAPAASVNAAAPTSPLGEVTAN
ncbi:hypothetical protein K439DRAFT_1624061 [Ramaria rubella]|nr:hypothetical protein K439DRAFT_1624061 [Ramaria rubella]